MTAQIVPTWVLRAARSLALSLSVCLLEVRGLCASVGEATERLFQLQGMVGPGPRASFVSSVQGQAWAGGGGVVPGGVQLVTNLMPGSSRVRF